MKRRLGGRGSTPRSGVAVLVLVTLAACGGEAEEANVAASIVLGPEDTAIAETTTIESSVVLTGTLNPYRRAEVKAQVPGVVTALAVDRGQSVAAGTVLARIQAQGITSQAAGARSAVAAAEANLALAQRQLESARTLFEAGAMSEINFRSAQSQFEAAQAQLSAAQAQATGAVEQAGRTVVESPIAGEISERSVNEGEAVNPGQTLFTVVNSAVLELEGQVPVDQAARVREGQEVVFTLDGYTAELRGTVSRVAPVADPGTRQVGVVMQLSNEDRSLIGGLFATGRVIVDQEESAVVVPDVAVRGSDTDAHVLVVDDGVVVRRPVQIGTRDRGRGVVAITSGIAAGERVITAAGEVQEGAVVQTALGAASEAPLAEAR